MLRAVSQNVSHGHGRFDTLDDLWSQVYKCKLRGQRGKTVAVKVQRPDMVQAVSLDLYLMRKYMHVVEAAKRVLTTVGLMNQPRPYDVALLDTFAKASYLELDYLHEV